MEVATDFRVNELLTKGMLMISLLFFCSLGLLYSEVGVTGYIIFAVSIILSLYILPISVLPRIGSKIKGQREKFRAKFKKETKKAFKEKFRRETHPRMLESMFIILSEKIEDSKEKAAIIMEDLQTDAEIVEEQVKAFVETVLQIWDKLVEEEGMADIFRSSKTETEKLERATGGAKYT